MSIYILKKGAWNNKQATLAIMRFLHSSNATSPLIGAVSRLTQSKLNNYQFRKNNLIEHRSVACLTFHKKWSHYCHTGYATAAIGAIYISWLKYRCRLVYRFAPFIPTTEYIYITYIAENHYISAGSINMWMEYYVPSLTIKRYIDL